MYGKISRRSNYSRQALSYRTRGNLAELLPRFIRFHRHSEVDYVPSDRRCAERRLPLAERVRARRVVEYESHVARHAVPYRDGQRESFHAGAHRFRTHK